MTQQELIRATGLQIVRFSGWAPLPLSVAPEIRPGICAEINQSNTSARYMDWDFPRNTSSLVLECLPGDKNTSLKMIEASLSNTSAHYRVCGGSQCKCLHQTSSLAHKTWQPVSQCNRSCRTEMGSFNQAMELLGCKIVLDKSWRVTLQYGGIDRERNAAVADTLGTLLLLKMNHRKPSHALDFRQPCNSPLTTDNEGSVHCSESF